MIVEIFDWLRVAKFVIVICFYDFDIYIELTFYLIDEFNKILQLFVFVFHDVDFRSTKFIIDNINVIMFIFEIFNRYRY